MEDDDAWRDIATIYYQNFSCLLSPPLCFGSSVSLSLSLINFCYHQKRKLASFLHIEVSTLKD